MPAARREPARSWLVPLLAVGGVVAVAVVVATLVLGSSRGTGGPAGGSGGPSERSGGASGAIEPPAAGWTELPKSPLSAREGATAAWTGSVVVVVGGTDGPPCPPNADCVGDPDPLGDGATYDPARRTWRSIEPAPLPIQAATTAVVGDTVFYWVSGGAPAFLAYDVEADAWRELPLPDARRLETLRIAPGGDVVVGFRGSHELGGGPDLAFDPESGTWSDLPLDPLGPSFDRSIVAVGDRLVLTGVELVPDPGVRPPFYRAAALDRATGEWRRFPDAEIVGFDPTWHGIGDLVINPSAGSSDGGDTNNWGRSYPHGGILDVAQGAWLDLPPVEGHGPTQGLAGATPRFVVSYQGWVLDVGGLAWLPLDPMADGPPGGAASIGAGDRLFMFGGSRFLGGRGVLLDAAWEWGPPLD